MESDCGSHFTSFVMRHIWKLLGVKRKLHLAYRPESSVYAERANRTGIHILKRFVSRGRYKLGPTPPASPKVIEGNPPEKYQMCPILSNDVEKYDFAIPLTNQDHSLIDASTSE